MRTFIVDVERYANGHAATHKIKVAACEPDLAAEQAERVLARRYGEANKLHLYFGARVEEEGDGFSAEQFERNQAALVNVGAAAFRSVTR